MGTDALPYLLRAITYTESSSRKKVISALKDLPGGPNLIELSGGDENHRAYPAMLGFRALGPEAAPALPRLIVLMNGTNSAVAYRAMQALAAMGKPGIPVLLAEVRDESRADRGQAAIWLDVAYRNANEMEEAAPVMKELLRNPDPRVVSGNIIGILQFPTAPDFAVPAFIELSHHTNAAVRYWAVQGLGRFGKTNQPAVQALRASLGDSEKRVRDSAKDALRKIAPGMSEGK
jgi:HEAT repeat protein